MSQSSLALSSPLFIRNKEKYFQLLRSAKSYTLDLNDFKAEIDDAFKRTLSMVDAYNELKQKHGFVVVSRCITLPTESVSMSYGKKLGYIQAVIRYFTQQVARYLTLLSEGERNYLELQQSFDTLDHREFEHDLVGMLQEFDFDDSQE
ncbi:hypothetical protein pIII [Penicillimonavirus gammaplasmopara]|nr:hypothetical protein pIII [Penicillimonavirus gammaplasmopara]